MISRQPDLLNRYLELTGDYHALWVFKDIRPIVRWFVPKNACWVERTDSSDRN